MLSSLVSQSYLAKVCLSQCISVWNFYSKLSLIAEEELHHPELESPEGKQEQGQPEEAHFEGEKNI